MSGTEAKTKDIAILKANKRSDIANFKKGSFGNNVVTQHNDLVTSHYDLNVTEKKLLIGCICKINSFNEITSDTPFSFSLDEAGEMLGVNPSNTGVVKQFRDAATNLMTKVVKNDGVDGWLDTTFAHTAGYNSETKIMTIYFSKGIIRYLSGLRDNLTSYRILHVGKLTSKYAIRLYEILVMWIGKDYRKDRRKKVSLVDFKALLGMDGDYADSVTMLKKAVITPATTQINERTDISVHVEYVKTGRTITHLILDFDQKAEWIDVETEGKKKLTKLQVDKIVNNADFFTKYFEEYRHLGGVTQFLAEARKLLMKDPKKHFSDYSDYLKDE